ncbi:MAG: hypothetical protein CMQ20_02660 [Gammaproteobacteria bacterium]|jgi:hypothetical protein|nr:hypothetical protein [Gammaproteobacteria bacterium]|tara:strand:- start:12513 stop:15467 length:2955 start_codon:yes stop_codon:yes gene_type:complete
MLTLDDVVEKLAMVNGQTAELLAQTIDSIAADEVQRQKWAVLCEHIAESGWHAWESADAYIKVSPLISRLYGTSEVLERGAFGLGLCGHSFEPAHSYFVGLHELIQSSGPDSKWENLRLIESTGAMIQQKNQHASKMLAAYFNAGFFILERYKLDDVSAWSELVLALANHKRVDLLKFLKLSNSRVPWTAALELQKVSANASLIYIESYPALERKYGQRLMEEQQPSFIRHAAGGFSLAPFFEALQSAALPVREATQLFRLLPEIPDVRLATCLIEQCNSLPLESHRVLRAWVLAGLEELDSNFEAALAFFRLESSRSIELLEELKGQVNFSDCRRVLQLYAEAISGRKIKVDVSEDDEADFRGMARNDGLCILLPDHVARFSGAAENFGFYKLTLLHQLGYFEFGTLDRISAIERELAAYDDELLAYTLFGILEDARIDWRLEKRFRGVADLIGFQKSQALQARVGKPFSRRGQLLESLVRYGLGNTESENSQQGYHDDITNLQRCMQHLNSDTAGPADTLDAVRQCYDVIHSMIETTVFSDDAMETKSEILPEVLPAPVDFHGEMDVKQVALNIELLELGEELKAQSDEDMIALASMIDPESLNIDEITIGEVQDAMAMLMTDLGDRDDEIEAVDEEGWGEKLKDLKSMLGEISKQAREHHQFLYDEWDHVIDDYRLRWCTLYEIRDMEEVPEFVVETLSQHGDLRNRVRKQLNMLKPELLRKIKGVVDGDEMDLERTVEYVVDRKAGFSPQENIYVQRQRKDRDVSALFLLDMSASTDDPIPDPDAAEDQMPLDDDSWMSPTESKVERIIDLEKQSVVLMAEALEELGDNYSVCGFSGYGRERVDYFLCKDFKEPYDDRTRGRIGGIEPCRSTRMGPAIRHATRSLVKTDSRIKALIIISDGYPQDFDYGKDRSSKDYGVRDTMKALAEARQQGVQSFCLTVDPSGHDYLREMCPDQQYMVIQDITQLPDELSKVYRSLTG